MLAFETGAFDWVVAEFPRELDPGVIVIIRQYSIRNPSILFVNPSLGARSYQCEDILRSYLSIGTLASALQSKSFLNQFAVRLEKPEYIFDVPSSCPEFDIRVLSMSLMPDDSSEFDCLADFLKLLDHPPIMVCTTATSAQLNEAELIAQAAEVLIPDAWRLIGGPHVSAVGKAFLTGSAYQAACVGEGVETLAEMALHLHYTETPDLSSIAGLVYKGKRGIIYSNPSRTPLMSLDEYPFPSHSLRLFYEHLHDPTENQKHLVYILAGYGCPFDCMFCAQRAIHGNRIRERSAEHIFKEIEKLHAMGFRRFAFVQETFLNRRDRIDAFCQLMKQSGLDIEWTAEARADQISFDLLQNLRECGFQFLQIGVESGDPALLAKIGKSLSLTQVIALKNWCKQLQIDTAFYMLVGLPGQDWQSVLRSAIFLRDHPPFNRITKHASVSIAVPYPGTRMARDQTVRMLESSRSSSSQQWPARNPEITVNENGEFLGENATETDDMTSEEILEAWLYLDDFSHFYLHVLYSADLDAAGRAKSVDYAIRMLTMLQRRTIRDLIVRAHLHLTAAKRLMAYEEILQIDGQTERHFKDVAGTGPAKQLPEPVIQFLAVGNFINGFETMKRLRIENRIKWMKICTLVWEVVNRKYEKIYFENDSEITGKQMNSILDTIDDLQLDEKFERLEAGLSPFSKPSITAVKGRLAEFGFTFSWDDSKNLFSVSLDELLI